jgi:hypothetical protein
MKNLENVSANQNASGKNIARFRLGGEGIIINRKAVCVE